MPSSPKMPSKNVDVHCATEHGGNCSPGTCTKCSPPKQGKNKTPPAQFITRTETFIEDQKAAIGTGPERGARQRRASWSRAAMMPNVTFQHDDELKELVNFGGTKDHLGKGSYGSVQRIKLVDSGLVRALKKIDKAAIDNLVRLKREILIMKVLDHPHIIRLHDVWESPTSLYLCMEVLSGGELFDEIVAKRSLSEKECANIMSQLLSVVAYIHNNSIAHRDLKPENILFMDQAKVHIKVIDWGFALRCEANHKFSSVVGTPYYVAPEVLYGNYNSKCDIWSCGVIMYILLCGYPPFYGNDNKDILRRVKQGEYYFDPKSWKHISEHAKDLIRRFLCYDPEHRPRADVASKHPWIQYYTVMNSITTGYPASVSVKSQKHAIDLRDRIMKLFGRDRLDEPQKASKNLKQLLYTTSAVNLSQAMQGSAISLYNAIDNNRSGYLVPEDILKFLKESEMEITPELRDAVGQLDTDLNGFIDYTEFLVVAVEERFILSAKILTQVFRTIQRTSHATGEGRTELNGERIITAEHIDALVATRGFQGQPAKSLFNEFFRGTKGKDAEELTERAFVEFMQKSRKTGFSSRAKQLFSKTR